MTNGASSPASGSAGLGSWLGSAEGTGSVQDQAGSQQASAAVRVWRRAGRSVVRRFVTCVRPSGARLRVEYSGVVLC